MRFLLLACLTLAGSLLAYGLFLGSDELAARLRRRGVYFDWFERTGWSGRRSTPAKAAATAAAAVLAGAAWLLLALAALAGLLALAVTLLQRAVG